MVSDIVAHLGTTDTGKNESSVMPQLALGLKLIFGFSKPQELAPASGGAEMQHQLWRLRSDTQNQWDDDRNREMKIERERGHEWASVIEMTKWIQT